MLRLRPLSLHALLPEGPRRTSVGPAHLHPAQVSVRRSHAGLPERHACSTRIGPSSSLASAAPGTPCAAQLVAVVHPARKVAERGGSHKPAYAIRPSGTSPAIAIRQSTARAGAAPAGSPRSARHNASRYVSFPGGLHFLQLRGSLRYVKWTRLRLPARPPPAPLVTARPRVAAPPRLVTGPDAARSWTPAPP